MHDKIKSNNLIDGRAISEKKLNTLKKIVQNLFVSDKRPTLAVVSVGNDKASSIYITNKQRACEFVGIKSKLYNLSQKVSFAELKEIILNLNNDNSITGILIQLPLPKHINTLEIIELINVKKDVDGLTPYNLGMLCVKHPTISSCTALGILHLLKEYKIPILSQDITIIGDSFIVGRPLGIELLNKGGTVTICHKNTKNLANKIQASTIIISAIGKPGIIKTEWLSSKHIIIDVGINFVNNRISGDIDFETAKNIVSHITPVPGGVGPMTVASLVENTIKLALLNK